MKGNISIKNITSCNLILKLNKYIYLNDYYNIYIFFVTLFEEHLYHTDKATFDQCGLNRLNHTKPMPLQFCLVIFLLCMRYETC